MNQIEFDNMCSTYANVMLDRFINRDEADANYEIVWKFMPERFKVAFFAIKRRNPKYMIETQVCKLEEIDDFDLNRWYKHYFDLKQSTFKLEWKSMI